MSTNKSYPKPWKWTVHPLSEREQNILISLLTIAIEHSESGNDWRQTPYSEDLRLIREKIEDIGKGE